MGVRGLTSFIARNAELYLKPYELHDCNLIIDGDNLACNLYKDVAGKNSAFGGDYDAFYRTVVEFFHVLNECNIRAYVLMDGGYEKKKLRTVWQRLRGKISGIKRIDPVNSRRIFPLMMREVFVDALRDCEIPVMRCVFEADDELAALGRKLNCPVLSYDSDFYIHNVKYIPLVTLTVKAHTKKRKDKAYLKEQRKLRKCDARNLEKRTNAQRILTNIHVDNEDRNAPKTGKTYKYLDCCMYKMENLFERKALSRDKLPLFAVLLGNDYIAQSAFTPFLSQMGRRGMTKKSTRQHKRIEKILQWLKHETLDSALEKILGSLKKPQRNRLLSQMKGAVEGYSSETCSSYDFFSFYYENAFDIPENATEREDNVSSDEQDEELEEETGEEEEEEEDDSHAQREDSEHLNDEEVPTNEENAQLSEVSQEEENNDDEDEDEDEDDSELNPADLFPQWFKDRLFPADLPRFIVDLVHLRIYINNPQIEHFVFNDCNEIGLPILKHIFAILYNVEGDEEDKLFPEEIVKEKPTEQVDSEEIVPYFRYVTRVTRVSNIHTVRYPLGPPPETPFNPTKPDQALLQSIFKNLKLDFNKLFEEINQIPPDLRLYFLSIIYWIQMTPHADLLHLHALLICLVVLRAVDSKVEPIRNERAFQKRFGTAIKREKQIRAKEQEEGTIRDTRPEVKELSPPDRLNFISKVDCLLVQENLLKHFHIPEIFKKKYDEFSTTVLHGFSEFQSVVFNLRALNGLLGNIYESPKMAHCFCGVFLYNVYGLLRSRIDLKYYIRQYIFRNTPIMFDLYEFLWNWCEQFIPDWQKSKETALGASKNVLKKRKATAKKNTSAAGSAASPRVDPNADMLEQDSTQQEDDDFYDLNNKFCTLLKVS